MINPGNDTALIISSRAGILNASSLLGTGGWLPPEDREELDWITLIKWMGWKSRLIAPDDLTQEIMNSFAVKWIILTGDPDLIDPAFRQRLFELLKTYPVLVVSRSGKTGSSFSKSIGAGSSGSTVADQFDWQGSQEQSWHCKKAICIDTLACGSNTTPVLTANEETVVAVNKQSLGKWVLISFHPSRLRDIDGCFTSILKHILVYQCCLPVAWYNFENTLVLRMDDPGSAQTVYHDVYQNVKLTETDWALIAAELHQRNARLTIGYVPGWVDDGDRDRGKLLLKGLRAYRKPGNVYLSPQVKYETLGDPHNKRVFDYASEFTGIGQMRQNGLAEPELHGYTHIHPDREAWLKAPDRHHNRSWYREFGRNTLAYIKNIPADKHPFALGIKAFREIFNADPSTLICPGDEFTQDVLQKALDAGLCFVSSYYLAIRIDKRLYWDQYVCAPYLDHHDAGWFDAGLPVIGYFHDFDISLHGMEWFTHCLDGWQNAGARHFLDFRELAGILSHSISLGKEGNSYQLKIAREDKWKPVRPFHLAAWFPESSSTIDFETDLSESTYTINEKSNAVIN